MNARAWIAALLVGLLPLQCLHGAIQSVTMPAHFHLLGAVADVAPAIQHPDRDDMVLEILDRGTASQAPQSWIGAHPHPFGVAGVVFVDEDGIATGAGTGGKGRILLDMLLPQWILPTPPHLVAAGLPARQLPAAIWPQEGRERPPRGKTTTRGGSG